MKKYFYVDYYCINNKINEKIKKILYKSHDYCTLCKTYINEIPLICEYKDNKLIDIITGKSFNLYSNSLDLNNYELYLRPTIQITLKQVIKDLKKINEKNLKKYVNSINKIDNLFNKSLIKK